MSCQRIEGTELESAYRSGLLLHESCYVFGWVAEYTTIQHDGLLLLGQQAERLNHFRPTLAGSDDSKRIIALGDGNRLGILRHVALHLRLSAPLAEVHGDLITRNA